MMNVFAISLIFTTLVTAGAVSPNDGNTKVSIKENGEFQRPSGRELVCDAFGKCEHRIASALEGTKDTVSEKPNEVSDKVEKIAKESVGKIVDKVKEGSKETAEKVRKAKDVSEISDTLQDDVKRNATEDLDIIEDAVKEEAHRLKVESIRGYQEIRRFFSDVSAHIFSSKNFRSFMGMIHLLGFALSYGVFFWVTFVSSNILARTLPKQQFAMVQSKIYPIYFKTLSYGVATAFLGHCLSQRPPYYANRTETIQGLIFLAIFSMIMFNSYYLEPRATKAMRERIKLEEEGKDVFNEEPSTTNLNTFIDPTGIRTGERSTTGETVETQQEFVRGSRKSETTS